MRGEGRGIGGLCLMALACAADTDQATVFFQRGETIVAVTRAVAADEPPLDAALAALLEGPTEEERAAGITSWFSSETADALDSVETGPDGTAVVDFADLHMLIPNATSSAGSEQLLSSLDSTVFRVPNVTAVEYRLNGSCDAFWEWLQRGCTVVRRPAS